jgi:cytochrome c-type biogenesis protein CcmF
MIVELGEFALWIALAVALLQCVLPIVGAARGDRLWMALAWPAARLQFVLVALAFGILTHAFVVSDFSVAYVAAHSTRALPLAYRVAAVWGGHEGSILLWILMLGLWMLAVSLFSRRMPEPLVARILGVMAFVSAGFLVFLLLTSSPFERLFPPAPEGADLNPMLQDPGMVIHPPLLYMGYVGFSVAFAFAIAALLGGTLDAAWARWSRPWTTVAWIFLTLGICIGSAWAYYTLGWGGWWFWDPVENASLMPWLVGTALIHSLAVTEKRGAFKVWTVLLAILAFSLSLLGTFLVRSGVLTSVHAFASDPRRGVFILGFLVLVVGGSLALFAWRAPRVGLGGRFALISREGALLANNVLMLAAAGTVALGTLYPIFIDALGLGKLSVGPPYFETVFVPLMAPMLFLMGVGPLARWKDSPLPAIAIRLRWALAVGVAVAIAGPLAAGRWSSMVALGLLLAAWLAASSLASLGQQMGDAALAAGWPARVQAMRRIKPAAWGMLVAHLGVAVFVAGVTLVKGYESEQDIHLAFGASVEAGPYQFTLHSVNEGEGPNYRYQRAQVEVRSGGHRVTELLPERRVYRVQTNPMTEAAIDRGFTRDLYVSLGEPVSPTEWTLRIYYKPFIDWIWAGCLLMALGGLLAVVDRRYRSRREREATAHAGDPA